MTPGRDRERLGATFDRAAAFYQRARPDYPPELFDDLIAVTGLTPGDRLLEVGCGTGRGSRPAAGGRRRRRPPPPAPPAGPRDPRPRPRPPRGGARPPHPGRAGRVHHRGPL